MNRSRPCLPVLLAIIFLTLGLAVGTVSFVLPANTASAGTVAHDRTPVAVPSTATPHVKNGLINAFAQVGNRMFVGGTFTQVANPSQSPVYTRNYLFAFNTATGAVDTGFAPVMNGVVTTITPAADGNSIYVGGVFTVAGGASHRNLARLSVTNGAPVPGFQASSLNGGVRDVVLTNGRLIVAGSFTTAGGVAHGGLTSLNAASGVVDNYVSIDVAENHNYPRGTARASVGVADLALSPDQTRIVALGNHRTADGLPRDQAMQILLQPGSAVVDPNWRTRRYEPACASSSFDSYVRDVQFSPDSSYFVIVTTGAGFTGTLCDTAAKFMTLTTGQDVQPTWTAYTGGDTLLSVEVTGEAVYVGGHQRWMNNPDARDTNGQGSVPRPGLAALDPRNGVPLSWNPGRNPRGIGAEVILATAQGVYVGSDTDYFGNYTYLRQKIGFFPLAGAPALVSQNTGQLPGNVQVLAPNGAPTTSRISRPYDGTTAGADTALTDPGIDWGNVRGAFMVGNRLFYAWSDGNFYTRTFDGTTFGAAVVVDPYNDPYWSNVTTGGTTNTYRGRKPTFYSQLGSVTGMYYAAGRLYYTLSGQNGLFYRGLSLDSLIVGPTAFTVSGATGFNTTSGMFSSGNQLYVASSADGRLSRITLNADGAPTGARTAVSGPGIDGKVWRARALFIGPGSAQPPVNQPPTASFTASCAALTCSFNASASSDPDGSISSYAWSYGDGSTGTGVTSSRTYAVAGTYTVSLTVTDNLGATGSTTRTVAPTTAPPTAIAFRGVASVNANLQVASVTVPAAVQPGDGLVLVLSMNTNSAPYGQPTGVSGFTAVGAPVVAGQLRTVVWQKVAVPGDAGGTISVNLGPSYIKANLTVLAYAGTAASGPIASMTTGADPAATTAHTSPGGTAAAGNWVLTVWTDKSSATTVFNPPGGVTLRDRQIGTLGGRLCSLFVDSGAAVAGGGVGGLTATTDASTLGTALTIVLTR